MSKIFDSSYKENKLSEKYSINSIFEEYVFNKNYPYYFDEIKKDSKYSLYDKNNNFILPNTNSLFQYFNNNGVPHRNLFFVVDAFVDLKKYYDSLLTREIVPTKIFNDLNVLTSTSDPSILYQNYLFKVYNVFRNNFLNTQRIKEIKNINNFIKQFTIFIKILTRSISLSRQKYFSSNQVPIDINGITISFSNVKNYSITFKANEIFSDPAYDFFVNNAGRFGFFIDKHSPWRILADFNSPAMKKYMKNYKLYSADEVYENYYSRLEKNELFFLKNILINFWNTYVGEFRTVVEDRTMKNCNITYIAVENMSNITDSMFEQNFSKDWLLRLYAYIRVCEERLNVSQVRFDSMHKESINIKNLYSEEQAVIFMNERIAELKNNAGVMNDALTNPDELLRMLSTYKLGTPVEGINF